MTQVGETIVLHPPFPDHTQLPNQEILGLRADRAYSLLGDLRGE